MSDRPYISKLQEETLNMDYILSKYASIETEPNAYKRIKKLKNDYHTIIVNLDSVILDKKGKWIRI